MFKASRRPPGSVLGAEMPKETTWGAASGVGLSPVLPMTAEQIRSAADLWIAILRVSRGESPGK